MPSTFDFRHNCSEALYFQTTPTLYMAPYYDFIIFHYQHFLLNMVSSFSFPQTAGTDVLENVNKLHQYTSILKLTSELSDLI